MSLHEQFSGIMAEIQYLVAQAQYDIADALEQYISISADRRVYSYEASDEAMEKRRYQLGSRDNLDTTVYDSFVEIQNRTKLREEPNTLETPWIEEGIDQGNAGPRPFMDEAMQDFMADLTGEKILAVTLRDAGFTVI